MNIRRPRRNRKSASIRTMIEETTLSINDFIYPLFLIEGLGKKEEITSMPGIYRFSLDVLLKEIQECVISVLKDFVYLKLFSMYSIKRLYNEI